MSGLQSNPAGGGWPSPARLSGRGFSPRLGRPGVRRGLPRHAVADVFDLPDWDAPRGTGITEALAAWRPGDGPVPVVEWRRRRPTWVCGANPAIGPEGACRECATCRETAAALAHLTYHREASRLLAQRWQGAAGAAALWRALGPEAASRWPGVDFGLAPEAALARGAGHARRLFQIADCLSECYEFGNGARVVGQISLAYVESRLGNPLTAMWRLEDSTAVRDPGMGPALATLAWDVLRCRCLGGWEQKKEPGSSLETAVARPRDPVRASRDALALLVGRGLLRFGEPERALRGLVRDLTRRSPEAGPLLLAEWRVRSAILDAVARAAGMMAADSHRPCHDREDPGFGRVPGTELLDDLRRRLRAVVAGAPGEGAGLAPGALLPAERPGRDPVPRPSRPGRRLTAAAPPWREWRVLLGEAARRGGFLDAMQAHLAWWEGRAAEQATGDSRPFWSPRPIVGFRRWRLGPDGLRGVYSTRWERPSLEAECERGPGAPHAGSSCHWCGIYAYAALDSLELPTSEETAVLGVVELTGRVVEHSMGYRAGRARVVAVAVCVGAGLVLSADPGWISSLFDAPEETLAGTGRDGAPEAPAALLIRNAEQRQRVLQGFLEAQARRADGGG